MHLDERRAGGASPNRWRSGLPDARRRSIGSSPTCWSCWGIVMRRSPPPKPRMLLRIPIAHIHGGEATEGAIDDADPPRHHQDGSSAFRRRGTLSRAYPAARRGARARVHCGRARPRPYRQDEAPRPARAGARARLSVRRAKSARHLSPCDARSGKPGCGRPALVGCARPSARSRT